MYELVIVILAVFGTIVVFSMMSNTVQQVVAPSVDPIIKSAWEHYSSLHFRDERAKRENYYTMLIDLMNAQHYRNMTRDYKITGRVMCRILLERLEDIYTSREGQWFVENPLRTPFVRYEIDGDELFTRNQDEFHLLTQAREAYENKGPKAIETLPETLTHEHRWEHTYQSFDYVVTDTKTQEQIEDLKLRQKAEAWERLTGKIV